DYIRSCVKAFSLSQKPSTHLRIGKIPSGKQAFRGNFANPRFVAGKPSGQDRNKNDLIMKTDTIDKQNEQKRNWVTHPTKRNLLIIVTMWFVGNSLLILSTTDLFTESFFNKKYIIIYAMMIMSTWTTFKVIRNYSKTRETIEQT
ncbi:hypothetical protein, partial [Marnyiella aurantia]